MVCAVHMSSFKARQNTRLGLTDCLAILYEESARLFIIVVIINFIIIIIIIIDFSLFY